MHTARHEIVPFVAQDAYNFGCKYLIQYLDDALAIGFVAVGHRTTFHMCACPVPDALDVRYELPHCGSFNRRWIEMTLVQRRKRTKVPGSEERELERLRQIVNAKIGTGPQRPTVRMRRCRNLSSGCASVDEGKRSLARSRSASRACIALDNRLILFGAGEGNRTLVVSLGSFCSTIELHPRH